MPDDPAVSEIQKRFFGRASARASASQSLFLRFLDAFLAKVLKQAHHYGRALENAGKALISIWHGMPMEELLRLDRLRRESAKIGAANGSEDRI